MTTTATRGRLRTWWGRPWARRGRDRGEGPIEMAIIALPLFFLTFTVVQAGLVFYARSVALAAATQAANTGREYNQTAAQAEAAAEADAAEFFLRAGVGLQSPTVDARRDAAGQNITVVVTGQAVSLVPGFTFPVRQQAHGPVERFVE